MRCPLAPISCRPWLLKGLSTRLIESRDENNYGGALRRLNAYVVNELKRDELIALNSTLLHKLYFGDLVVGRKSGRTHADEIAVFDSTGVAIQDVASAAWIYRREIAAKVGTIVSLSMS